MQADLNNNAAVAQSLQRLAKNLRALVQSLHGEDPSESSESHLEPENDFEPTEDPRLHPPEPPKSEEEQLLDLLNDREDWAIEREREIVRLEKENEELRKLLGIDHASAEANGWLEEEARERTFGKRRIPIHAQPHPPPPPQRESSPGLSLRAPPGSTGGGMGMGLGGGMSGAAAAVGGGGGGVFDSLGQSTNFGGIRTGNGSMQHPGMPLQRASELQPGTRGAQGRRPFMFG